MRREASSPVLSASIRQPRHPAAEPGGPACVRAAAGAALPTACFGREPPGSYHVAMRPAVTLLAVLALFPAVAGGATAKWRDGAPLPLARGEVTAARVGSEIFVVGGFTADGQNSARTDVYSPEQDAWGQIDDLPVSVDHAMSAGYREKLYVAGGYAADRSRLTTLFSFSNGSWTRLPSMPEERAAAGAAVVGGKLYVVGGVTAGGSGARALAKTALVYDIARRTWSSIPGPTPREHLGVAALREIGRE